MVLQILDSTGHTELTTEKLSVEEINAKFDELVSQGYLTYKTSGNDAELIRTFDPTAENIVAHAPMVGG